MEVLEKGEFGNFEAIPQEANHAKEKKITDYFKRQSSVNKGSQD